MRKMLFSSIALLGFMFCATPRLVSQSYGPMSTSVIPAASLMQPEALNKMLQAKKAPVILQVGSHLLFTEAHIAGSKYIGPGSAESGLQALQNAVASLPKDRLIVLYCGCCPWSHCPNVGGAWKRLSDLGYKNVKVLYLPNNFGDDWMAKGYSTEQ